jgi:hypothetical protein
LPQAKIFCPFRAWIFALKEQAKSAQGENPGTKSTINLDLALKGQAKSAQGENPGTK